jgi:hypothetical protein
MLQITAGRDLRALIAAARLYTARRRRPDFMFAVEDRC